MVILFYRFEQVYGNYHGTVSLYFPENPTSLHTVSLRYKVPGVTHCEILG